MKKSLQYVLIMSALGLQSGVLLAEPEFGGKNYDQSYPANPMLMTEFELLIKEIINRDDYYINQKNNLMKWVINYTKTLPSNARFTPDVLDEFSSENRRDVLNMLTESAPGVEFLNGISRDSKRKYMKELLEKNLLEKSEDIHEFQAGTYLAAVLQYNINSPELKDNLSKNARKRLVAFRNSSSEESKSNNIDAKTGLSVRWFSFGAFMSFSTQTFEQTISTNNIMNNDAVIDLNFLSKNSDLSEKNKAFFGVWMLATKLGRNVYVSSPRAIREEILKIVINGKPSTALEAKAIFDLAGGVFKAEKEHPKAKILGNEEQRTLLLKMVEVAKKNSLIKTSNKIALIKDIENGNKGAKELEIYKNFKEDTLKSVPKDKIKQVDKYLSDKKNLGGDDFIDDDLFFEDIEFTDEKIDQKRKNDDVKKDVPKFQAPKKRIEMIEDNEAVGVGSFDIERKKIDEVKKKNK